MSMDPEQEEFQDLRRLLALKRHEQPPPGYFDSFSREVVARIQAEQPLGAEDLLTHVEDHAPWLARLWSALQTKPLLAGAFGACVCGLLVTGLVLSERVEPGPVVSLPEPAQPQPLLQAHVTPASPLFQRTSATGTSSTEGLPSTQPQAIGGSLLPTFGQPASPMFQTLEYKTGAH